MRNRPFDERPELTAGGGKVGTPVLTCPPDKLRADILLPGASR